MQLKTRLQNHKNPLRTGMAGASLHPNMTLGGEHGTVGHASSSATSNHSSLNLKLCWLGATAPKPYTLNPKT